MKKLLTGLLTLSSLLAFAQAEISKTGKLYELEERIKPERENIWHHIGDECSLKIKNVSLSQDGTILYDAELRKFGSMAPRKVNAELNTWTYAKDQTSRSSGMGNKGTRISLYFDEATREEILNLDIEPDVVYLDRLTFSTGYFGGKAYKWRYKCVF